MEKLAAVFLTISGVIFCICVTKIAYRAGYARGKYEAFNVLSHVETLENQDEGDVDNPPDSDLPDSAEELLPNGARRI